MTAIPAQLPQPRTQPAWIGGNMPFARFGLIINLLVPVGLLAWDALHHNLGADPVNYAIHTTGLLALLWITLSLAVTPVRAITGWSWLIQFRRSLGVYAFYYASAHLAIFFWWDRQRSLSSTVHEITHRWYLIVGFTALSLMLPLWATSFNGAIRWMGGKKWKLLHRLAYASAALGAYHFWLEVKHDHTKPLLFVIALSFLLGFRVVVAIKRRLSPMPRSAVAGGAMARTADGKLRFYKGPLKVVEMVDETPNVRTFRLAAPDGGPIPFAYSAGQFLNLQLQIDGKKVSRSYTIASPPTWDDHLELTIKREENGQVSRYLHEMLMKDQTVQVSAPSGRFTVPEQSRDGLLLIAGGVGITPVMSILRDQLLRRTSQPIDLVFCVRTPADIIFAKELEKLAAQHDALHVHITLTRDVPPDWTGPRGRITADLLNERVPNAQSRIAFICGPNEMAAAAKEELKRVGLPDDRIKLESFTPAAAAKPAPGTEPDSTGAPATSEVGTITFALSNQTAPIPSNKTVLEVAESCGVHIDYDCRSGICGQCRTKLLSGQVTMAMRDALTDADEQDGFILACQAKAAGDVEVEA